jgi:Na+/H+-dicarboxylate symporter
MKQSHSVRAILILSAVGAGVLTGVIFGREVEFLGPWGMWIIQLIKILATPLIFFSIVDGMGKTGISARSGFHLVAVSGVNALVAGAIALSIPMIFPVSGDFQWMNAQATAGSSSTQVSIWAKISFLFPNVIQANMIQVNVIHVILAAIGIALTLRFLSQIRHPKIAKNLIVPLSFFNRFFHSGLRWTSKLVGWVILVIPISVFAVVASLVGQNGVQVFTALSHFILLITGCLLLHALVFYSAVLKFQIKTSPIAFFENASEALATAFGTGSSLATLPTTLKTLIEKMGVTPKSARLSACIGTNLNHVGILLYEAVTALFIAQAYGIPMEFTQKITLLGSSIVAAIGIAGIPDAGLITLSLVLSSVHLPLESLPVLMTVDWFIGRLRASVNVTSDMVVAHVLDSFPDRFNGKFDGPPPKSLQSSEGPFGGEPPSPAKKTFAASSP